MEITPHTDPVNTRQLPVLPRNDARLVVSLHPISASANRQIIYTPFLRGESIAQYLQRVGITFNQPVALSLNDRRIAMDGWASTYPVRGDMITARALVQGGGDGGSDPLRTILTIAVLAAAGPAGEFLAGAVSGITSAAVATSVVTIGGMLLVNALVPTPKPPDFGDSTSPTYSITSGANRARLFQPLPLIMGTHRVVPDLGARTFTEIRGEDQYLYQIFNFGLSDVVLSELKIGDTLISDYDEAETEETGTGDWQLTSFPGNVDTVAGGTLDHDGSWVQRTTSIDTTMIGLEVHGLVFMSDKREGMVAIIVNLEFEYRAVGSSTWLTLHNWEVRNDDRTPVRVGFKQSVPSGQYEVRGRFVNALRPRESCVYDSSPEVEDYVCSTVLEPVNVAADVVSAEISWANLKSYQPDTANYTGQKRVALTIKATGQLQGQVDQFNAMVSARCPVWNGSSWVTGATSNPAWWFLWFARGAFDGSRRLYGAGLADARIDIEALKDWGAWCDARALQFNAVIDRGMSCFEVLQLIARCGRAAPTWATGTLGVVWDASEQPSVMPFGMNNIVRNSFRVNYATGRLPDEVVVNFINPDNDWQPDTVRATVPGVASPQNPITIDLFGCTSESQAGREANLIAAEQAYRRRQISWETDMQGMVVQRGDVVTLSHDLTQWGQSGRLIAGTTTVLELSRPVQMTFGVPNYIGVRYPDGSYDVYDVAYAAGDVSVVTLYTPLPSAPNDDTSNRPEDYGFVFAPEATPGKRVKITDIKPLSAHRVRITATDETEDYYLAEFNSYVYVPRILSSFFKTPTITGVEIRDTLIRIGGGFGTRISVSWDAIGEYGSAIIRAASFGQQLKEMGKTTGRNFEFNWDAQGNIIVEVTLASLRGFVGANSRNRQTYVIVGKAAPPDDVVEFTASLQDFNVLLSWLAVPDVDVSEYELRAGTDWNTADFIDSVKATQYLHPMAGAGTYNFLVKAKDSSQNYSLNAMAAQAIVANPSQPVVSSRFQGENFVLSWAAAATSFPIIEFEIRTGTDWASGTFVDSTKSTSYSSRADFGGTRQFWVAAIDAAGNYSDAANINITITAPPAVNLVPEVIDNNVLLRWGHVKGSLPIAYYEVRKGAVFASAEVLQTVNGTFASFFENESGAYVYWLVPVDSALNYGTEISVATNVNEPPDYRLNVDWYSDFSGSKTSALVMANGDLLVPIDIAASYADHFINNGYSTPQAQIDAGFAHFIQPSVTSAVYEEEFDYGAVLPATLVKAALSATTIDGDTVITPTISTKRLPGDSWNDRVGVWQIFATDFQYVKISLNFAAAGGDDLLQCHSLNVRLDTKLINDAGSGTADAGDVGGTPVSFNKTFIDVESITVSANATAAVNAVYDFLDVANATTFYVYLFDAVTGARVSGGFSWSAKGF